VKGFIAHVLKSNLYETAEHSISTNKTITTFVFPCHHVGLFVLKMNNMWRMYMLKKVFGWFSPRRSHNMRNVWKL